MPALKRNPTSPNPPRSFPPEGPPAADGPPASSRRPRTKLGWAVWLLTACRQLFLENTGWFVSIVLHVVLLGSIAFVAIRQHFESRPVGLDGFVSDLDIPAGFDNIGEGASIDIGSPEGSLDAFSRVASTSAGGEGDFGGPLSDLFGGGGAGPGLGSGSGGTGDGGGGGGDGVGLGASFFGSQGAGRTFVFVVDMSGSMWGQRFERAKKELVNAIMKLKPQQKFYIFFFSDQTLPLFHPKPAKEMLAASKSNKDKASRWIRAREPGGLTNPMLSLRQALEMKPDAIFLLTDGEVDDPDELRQMIQKTNHGTTIHTIAFEDEEGAATLESIAKDNKGSFRFVR